MNFQNVSLRATPQPTHALIFMVNGKNLLFIRVLAFRLVSAVLRAQQLSTNRQDWLLTAGGMAPLGDPNA